MLFHRLYQFFILLCLCRFFARYCQCLFCFNLIRGNHSRLSQLPEHPCSLSAHRVLVASMKNLRYTPICHRINSDIECPVFLYFSLASAMLLTAFSNRLASSKRVCLKSIVLPVDLHDCLLTLLLTRYTLSAGLPTLRNSISIPAESPAISRSIVLYHNCDLTLLTKTSQKVEVDVVGYNLRDLCHT